MQAKIRALVNRIVSKKLVYADLCLPNGEPCWEWINCHVPNMDHTKSVSLIYYLILIPEYLSLVQKLCDGNLLDHHPTILPDNVCDPLNFCHPVYIPILWKYGFVPDLERFRMRFIEGVCNADTLRAMFACIDAVQFCSNISYDEFINRMVISVLASSKRLIMERYMLALAYMFQNSRNIFTTQHLNKLMATRNPLIIQRVIRYAKLHPTKFQLRSRELWSVNDDPAIVQLARTLLEGIWGC